MTDTNTSKKADAAQSSYHHGDLRNTLLTASLEIIQSQGIEGLSLRKLAEKVGVSRTAPYHHFKDKNALLAAVAEQGFTRLSNSLEHAVRDETLPIDQRLHKAVMEYLQFALEHATQYDLMFGKSLWTSNEQVDFQRHAKDCFRQYVHLYEQLQLQGLIDKKENTLRLAQLMWATLHGLAKLAEEGIFGKRKDLEEIAAYALKDLTGC